MKTENIPPHLSLLNVFDNSCKQNNDDGFVVNNAVDVQEMLKNVNADIPIFIDDKEETIEEAASYSDEYTSIANETSLVSLDPQTSIDNDCINIASGEGKQLKSILNDKFCEELAFPYLFPAGKFGYRVKKDVKLSPVKYFNQRLLHTVKSLLQSKIIFYLL